MCWCPEVLTFVPLQLILRHVCTAIKVFLKRVHLPAQDISEGLHLCQLLSQAVTLLGGTQRHERVKVVRLLFMFPWTTMQSFWYTCADKINSLCTCAYKHQKIPHVCRYKTEAKDTLSL